VRAEPLDREALRPHLLAPGLHAVLVSNERLAYGQARADRMDVVLCTANVESLLPHPHPYVQVLVMLNSSADMRFIDRSEWWPATADPLYSHVSSPTYASGAAIADSMLHPLLMGWFKHGLIELATRLTDSVVDATEVKLIELPTQFHTPRRYSYGEMVPVLMEAGFLPIALYRLRAINSTFYVHTNPPHATVLRPSDCVYVIVRAAKTRNYSASAARLERAAFAIQRNFRARAERRWADGGWGGGRGGGRGGDWGDGWDSGWISVWDSG
jgi:hypothetical protein